MSLSGSKEIFNLVFKGRFLYRLLNVVFLTFIFFFFFNIATLFFNLNIFFQKASQEVIFYAFIDKAVSKEDVLKLKKNLSLWPETKTVNLISEDEGLKLLKKSLGKDAEILKTLEKNPLPITFEITLKPNFAEKTSISSFKDKLSKYKEISWFDSTERYIGPILQMKEIFRNIFIGSFIFLLAMIFISFRLSLRVIMLRYSHEFQLLKLLGAKDSFIIIPFVVESFLESLLSAILASLFTYYLTTIIKDSLSAFNITIESLSLNHYLFFSLIFSLFSALSTFSLKKFRET